MLLASIPSPSFNSFNLGPLEIHLYGVLIAIGVAVAFTVTRRRYEARGGDGELLDRIMMWTVIAGFLGARAAYVSTHLDRFAGEYWKVIAIWEGGLALFGGLTVGTLTAVALSRRWGADVPAFADSAAVAVPLAQAIGRWGNYFNQELFGTPTDLPWAVEIDPAIAARHGFPGETTFHPTFLYESLYNLLVVVILLRVERRRSLRAGSLLGVYAVLYGIGRFLLELLRTDTEFRLLGLSRNGWVSLLVVAAASAWLVWRERRPQMQQTAVATTTEPDEPPVDTVAGEDPRDPAQHSAPADEH